MSAPRRKAGMGRLLAAVTDDWERGKSIAERAGIDPRTAGPRLMALVREGFVETTRNPAPRTMGGRVAVYRRGPKTRDVRSTPICSADGTCRGWVRLDADRVGHANQTEFCVTIDSTSYLSPFEARAFAAGLKQVAAEAEEMLGRGSS